MVSQVDLIAQITAFYGPAAGRAATPAPVAEAGAAVA
jgi:hypothetical protein